jgi:hypothetical protein
MTFELKNSIQKTEKTGFVYAVMGYDSSSLDGVASQIALAVWFVYYITGYEA